MTKAYQIYNVDSGEVVAIQTLDDLQRPILTAGQAAMPIPVHVVDEGTFTSTNSGTSVVMIGAFNVSVWGTFSATVVLERSFDAETTWLPVSFPDGTNISYTAAGSGSWAEIEYGVYYRLRCSAFTSGTVNWRISR